jgi:hypothetical protein
MQCIKSVLDQAKRAQTHLPEQGHGILDVLTVIFAGHPLPMAWGSEVSI